MTKFHPRRAATAIATLTIAALALSACGRAHDSNPAPSDASHLASIGPAATKNIAGIRWNLSGGEPSSLDPQKVFSGSDLMVESNLCESLLTLTGTNEIVPGLAASIDRPSDTEYVVHLRPGVTFSDGTPMTAADVVFSLDRIRDPKAGSYWGAFAENVKSVTETDTRTVTIRMSAPDAVFYQMLATPVGQVIEKAYAERAGSAYGSAQGGVMCTGPYTLQKWDQGNEIVLKANPHWWNIDQQPLRTASVTFSFLTDDSTIASALLNGDVDGTMDLSSTTLPKLLTANNGQVLVGPSTRQFAIVPTKMTGNSPLADPKIRQAFAKSIDYQGLLATTLATVYKPLRTITPPGSWGYSKPIFKAAYDQFSDPARDIAGAKKLLAEAGNAHPTVVLEVPSDYPQYVTIGETIQSNAKDAGFDVKLELLSGAAASAMFTDSAARNKVDAFLTDYFSDIPDPLELYMQIGTPDGASNFNGYDDPAVAKLLNQARGTFDNDARAELTVQAQAQMTKQLVWIPLAYPQQSVFINDKFGGATASFPSVLYTSWFASIGGR